VVDVVRELARQGARVEIYDPWADAAEFRHEYGLKLTRTPQARHYDVAVMAVAHREFRDLGVRGVRRLLKKPHVLYDIKHLFPAAEVDGRL
jgi:UDP-N-acetyl-D-galactosamine dehydrogenase